jgi:hypothetical protein
LLLGFLRSKLARDYGELFSFSLDELSYKITCPKAAAEYDSVMVSTDNTLSKFIKWLRRACRK